MSCGLCCQSLAVRHIQRLVYIECDGFLWEHYVLSHQCHLEKVGMDVERLCKIGQAWSEMIALVRSENMLGF